MKKNSNILLKLKKICLKDKIPIMRPKTLETLSKLAMNKTILEIGTGYGYSSLFLFERAKPKAITTIEKNINSFKKAKFFLKKIIYCYSQCLSFWLAAK